MYALKYIHLKYACFNAQFKSAEKCEYYAKDGSSDLHAKFGDFMCHQIRSKTTVKKIKQINKANSFRSSLCDDLLCSRTGPAGART